jgi:NRPS condensation-like uncharacterized protein
MLADTRDTHPLTFFLKLEIAERLDLQRLQAALEQCVRYHPLLLSTIHRRRGRWLWKPHAGIPTVDQHTFQQYPESRSAWGIDPTREVGWRMSLAEQTLQQPLQSTQAGSPTELWLQVHHSCADARGMLHFLADLQAAYHQLATPERVRQRELQAQQHLPQRQVGFSQHLTDYSNPTSPKWKRIWNYYAHRSRPLAPSQSAAHACPAKPAFLPHYLSCQLPFDLAHWQQQRCDRNIAATVNDYLLHSVFRGLASHQARLSPQPADPWLRVGVPIDMRAPRADPPIACNCSSLVFLDRRLQTILRDPNLLKSIHAEMKHIKEQRLGCVFFDVLAWAHHLPGAMRLAVNDRRCAVTAVASNLGAVSFPSVEGFTVKAIDFFPPLRRGTAIALGVSSYAHTLHFSLHYDHRLISVGDAHSLLNDISGNTAGHFAESLETLASPLRPKPG